MVTGIIQARLGSTRLPGKVMRQIEDRPMLWHVVNRLNGANLIERIVIATSDKKIDTPITMLAGELGLPCYAGSENDVLDRYYRAATRFGDGVIVRITADCALIDPHIVDNVIRRYLKGDCDYAANTLKPTYPDGLDVEVFSYAALEKAWKEARWASEREHVTPYIRKNPGMFRLANVESPTDLSRFRWSVDLKEDLSFVRQVFRHLYKEGRIFHAEDILRLIEEHPSLAEINRGIVNNEGYEKSLLEDRLVK